MSTMARVVKPSLLVAVTAVVLVGGAYASPRGLYSALLSAPYRNSELPHGFRSAKIGAATPSADAKRHHAVGEVEVAVQGPDPNDGIFYGVFPTQADAKAVVYSRPNQNFHRLGPVPGYRQPSAWFTGSVTGKTSSGQRVTHGVTAMAVVQGSVLVGVITDSATVTLGGDVPAARSLLASALRHLARVQH